MPKKPTRTPLHFESEAEEAAYWQKHKAELSRKMNAAIDAGTVQRGGPRAILEERRQAAKNITIRVAEADLALAKKQATARGLAYQTYMKMLLHQALEHEERAR